MSFYEDMLQAFKEIAEMQGRDDVVAMADEALAEAHSRREVTASSAEQNRVKHITYKVDKQTANYIDRMLNWDTPEDEWLTEDETIVETVVLDENIGLEADIKCCGADGEPAWCEAVLFKDGYEVSFTDVEDDFFGEWEFEYDGILYVINVVAE